MKRRDILITLGGTMLGAALGADAQTAKSARRVGTLGLGVLAPPDELRRIWAPARELGWVEGQNLLVERRWTTKPELLQPYAEELVGLNVELIVANGTAATLAAKNATTRIPIVMFSAGDPLGTGLVPDLAKPGGNVTGYSAIAADLDAKRLALLRELLPGVRRVGVLIDPANLYYRIVRDESDRRYRSFGFEPVVIEVAANNELSNAVAQAAARRAQALDVSHLTSMTRAEATALMRAANEHALPTIAAHREFVELGGLVSLMPDENEQYRVFAYFLDKILRGAKPSDLPVQQPSKFVLSINLKTAKALGVTVPQPLLLRADEVL